MSTKQQATELADTIEQDGCCAHRKEAVQVLRILSEPMNCATCKHWKLCDEYEAGHSQGLGRCMSVPMLWDVTEWRDDADGRVFTAEAEGTTAFAQDGSDYRAFLLTRPEHGCTMHAPAAVSLPPMSGLSGEEKP